MVIVRVCIYCAYILFLFLNIIEGTNNIYFKIIYTFIPIFLSEVIIICCKIYNKYYEIKMYEIIQLVSCKLDQLLFMKFIVDYKNFENKRYSKFLDYTYLWFEKNVPEYDLKQLIDETGIYTKVYEKFLKYDPCKGYKLTKGDYLFSFYSLFNIFAFASMFLKINFTLYSLVDLVFFTIYCWYYLKNKTEKYLLNIQCIEICLVSMIMTIMTIINSYNFTYYMALYIFIKIIYSLILILTPFSEIYKSNYEEFNSLYEKKIYQIVSNHKNIILWCSIFIIIGYNILCFSFINFIHSSLPEMTLFEKMKFCLFDSTLNYFTGQTIFAFQYDMQGFVNLLQIILSFITNTVILSKLIEFLYSKKKY